MMALTSWFQVLSSKFQVQKSFWQDVISFILFIFQGAHGHTRQGLRKVFARINSLCDLARSLPAARFQVFCSMIQEVNCGICRVDGWQLLSCPSG